MMYTIAAAAGLLERCRVVTLVVYKPQCLFFEYSAMEL
jgi:hypothetical protein